MELGLYIGSKGCCRIQLGGATIQCSESRKAQMVYIPIIIISNIYIYISIYISIYIDIYMTIYI